MGQELQIILAACAGAATAFVTLWQRFKTNSLKIRELELKLTAQEEEHKAKLKSDDDAKIEGQWKRILEYRDKEIEALKAKDDQQERMMFDLINKNVDCQRADAANQEKIKNLEGKVAELTKLLSKINPNVVAESLLNG